MIIYGISHIVGVHPEIVILKKENKMEGLPIYVLALAFVGGLLLLVKGADWFVEGASALAKNLGMSSTIIGLTVVAIGTSAPEFAVSTYASLQGSGDIALANVVGSNIFNLGFILALIAIIAPFSVKANTVYRDMMMVIVGSSLLTAFALMDNHVSRLEGSVLVTILVGYLFYLWKRSKEGEELDLEDIPDEPMTGLQTGIRLVIGLGGLIIGCNLTVESAKTFALSMGMSEWLIGVTIIATGTSLPELVTAITSLVKKKTDIGVGGLIGSDIFNILGVIGSAALIKPLAVNPDSAVPFGFLIFATILTAIFLRNGWKMTRTEGWILMGIATIRYLVEIF